MSPKDIKIVYINGYKGSNSSKAKFLYEKYNAKHIVLQNDFNIYEVCKTLNELKPNIVVASSTGCFVTDSCNYNDAIFIYLNPLVELDDLVKIGADITNLKNLTKIEKKPIVLLNKDDKLLDYKKAMQKYNNIITFEKGGHKFKNTKDLIKIIDKYTNKYMVLIKTDFKLKDAKSFHIDLYISLDFDKDGITAQLLSWSNDKQKQVPLKDSVVYEFLDDNEYKRFKKYYGDVVKNYLYFLEKTLKTKEQKESYISKILKPKIIFHKKFYNYFNIEILEDLYIKNFTNNPILDIKTFEFLSNVVDGFFVGADSNGNNALAVDILDDKLYMDDTEGNKMTSQEVIQRLEASLK